MKLSMFERMVLANQYMIMLKLCGNEDYIDEGWAKDKLQAVMSGYEMHYDHDGIDLDTMSVEESTKVIDTLAMYREFHAAVEKYGKPKETRWLTFQGYDGNYEGRQMVYAEYYCTHDHGRFEELKIEDFNSHCGCKEHYERMVEEWKKSADKRNLTLADVERILAAA